MKRISTFFSSIILMLAITGIQNTLNAQDCEAYFPTEEGTVLTFENYNQRDKLQSKMIQELKSITSRGDTTVYNIHQRILDDKDKLLYEGDLEFKCHDNKFYIDMESYINPQQMESYQGMDIEITMDEITLPDKLEPGMELDEGYINMAIDAQMMTMNFNTRIFNRKVEAKEELTTPAGTFEAYKIASQTETKTTMMNVTTKSITWYNEDYGMIRSENYNKRDKLDSYSVLVKVER